MEIKRKKQNPLLTTSVFIVKAYLKLVFLKKIIIWNMVAIYFY